MIFTGSTKQTPYTSRIKGVYKHRVDYRKYSSSISRRNEKLCQLVFDTYETAEKFCNTLIDYISEYGSITVEETINEYDAIYDDNDYTATFYDSRYGWTNLPSKTDDMIVGDGYSWRVVLPKPAVL